MCEDGSSKKRHQLCAGAGDIGGYPPERSHTDNFLKGRYAEEDGRVNC
jgi:hypothetical protein